MERPQTVENLPILYLDHRPRKMDKIHHGFILETVSAGLANRYFILTSNGKTFFVVVVNSKLSAISHVRDKKQNFVCTIRSVPKIGERMKITRTSIESLKPTICGKYLEDNVLLSGPLVMEPMEIWQGFYYVESENSAYFFCR